MIPEPDASKSLIVTFLPDSTDEKTYAYRYDLAKFVLDLPIPRKDDIINFGGSFWHVVQVVHEWAQHENNLCLSVVKLPSGKPPPYPVTLKRGECTE